MKEESSAERRQEGLVLVLHVTVRVRLERRQDPVRIGQEGGELGKRELHGAGEGPGHVDLDLVVLRLPDFIGADLVGVAVDLDVPGCQDLFPVEVESEVDEYPAGRTLTILDSSGKQMMQLENVVDAYPSSPRSDEGIVMTQTYAGVDNIPGQSTVKRRYFVQPHFAISSSQLKRLMAQHQSIARILVDTYRADNFWNYYLSSQADQVDLSMIR